LLLLGAASLAHAQNRGQADIALQGFYQGGSSQALLNTTGVAFHFQDFMPGVGYFNGSFEGYGAQNRLQTGETFLELRGAAWRGMHWTITGGDFHTPGTLLESPLTNIFTPEIAARGVRVQASSEHMQYSFFTGQETLTAGPRVPYRVLAPQTLMGVSAVRKVSRNLKVGARLMQFSSSPQAIVENPSLFPAGLSLTMVRTAAVQALYTPAKKIQVYAEVSKPEVQAERALLSSLMGVVWDTRAVSVRADFVRQGAVYFPLAGYFAGDRQGPFVELRVRPWKKVELYCTASQYRNNLERNPSATSLTSLSSSGGITTALPGNFSGSAQVSNLQFTSQAPGEDLQSSSNQQVMASLNRNVGRHSMHLTWREMKLDMLSSVQRQSSTEFEDMVQVKRLFLGGAVRWQQQSSGSVQNANSLFYRVSAQGTAGRLSLYANVEIGNDLANRTVFSTSTYSTTVIGAGLRLFRQWNLQAEVFRNKLNMELNPENIFLLQGGGIPVSESLADLMTWSFFFRLTKQLRWGGGVPTENVDQFTAKAVPLTGTVQGVVRVKRLTGQSLASGIPVTLDGGRTATTGADGTYIFDSVPEGPHEVALSAAELPADYDPGPQHEARVLVQPRRMVRTDFDVLPLAALEGQVTGPEKVALDGILIRLLPGSRYTTTGNEGHFAFYNVREGDYELVLDPKTLPEDGELQSPAIQTAVVRASTPAGSVSFSFTINPKQKPIRKVLDRK